MGRRIFPTAFRTVVLIASLGVIANAAGPEPTAEARAHFKAGVEHLDAKRYDEAYRELKAAYAIAAKPKLLGNIGIAAEHLERDGDAIDAYQGYLDGHALSAREAELVRRSLERLRRGIATVTLEVPGTFWVVDTRLDAGARLTNEYGPFYDTAQLRVRAGEHEFKLERASIAASAWSVMLRAGDVAIHEFASEPPAIVEAFEASPALAPSDPETDVAPRSHTASYLLWGTGGLGAVATSVFLLKAESTQDEADQEFARRCPLGAGIAGCESRTRGSEQAASWRTAGLISGIGAIGAAAIGTVLYVLDSSDSQSSEHDEAASVQPWLSPTAMGVSGTF